MASEHPTLHTQRLSLRLWRDTDLPLFAKINRDPRVMRYMPAALSSDASDRLASRIRSHFDQHGFGLWAVEVRHVAPFVGFVGLAVPRFEAHFTPCVEIGWRIACEHWGRGYATEAAKAALAFGFDQLALPEVVSLTVPANLASRRVMEKIGMHRSAQEDFDHPTLPAGHTLRRHVLYRLKRAMWNQKASQ